MDNNLIPRKISAPRRKGDAYELHLFMLQCLRMVVEGKIEGVYHEYRPALPIDDVVVELQNRLDCYQAKHATNPHELITLEDILEDTDLGLNIKRLKEAWENLRSSGKEVRVHIYTNRAADANLAKILQDDCIAGDVINNTVQKRIRKSLKDASGIDSEGVFIEFLTSLRFDLRQKNLDELREHIQKDWIERQLGLHEEQTFLRLTYNVELWWLESQSRPITKDEVIKALQIDSGTLSQIFEVDRHYVSRPEFEQQLDRQVNELDSGYVAIVGPPGSGKSTFLTRYIQKYQKQHHIHVLRYYCFLRVNDPRFHRRVSGEEFLRSMVEQIWREYADILPTQGRYDYSSEKLYELLEHLGKHFHEQNSRLLMVIDGVDHAERADVDEAKKLMKFLPNHLPEGVVCIIGSQGLYWTPITGPHAKIPKTHMWGSKR